MLTIDNLSNSQDLDTAAASELSGGYYGNTYFSQMSSVTNVFSQNAVNLGISAGDAGIVSLNGGISLMPVSAGSAMTFVYSPQVPGLAQ